MVKLNKDCMSDRSVNAGAYKYMRSEAKRMLKECTDPVAKRFCECMMSDDNECWTFIYKFLLEW